MSGNMWGANVDQLDTLARTFEANADTLSSSEATITNTMSSTNWVGDDADVFHQDWAGVRQPQLQSMVDALREAARQLHEDANQQRAASGEGGAGAIGGGGTAVGGGDGITRLPAGLGAAVGAMAGAGIAAASATQGIAPGGCVRLPWGWGRPIYRIPERGWPLPRPPWQVWPPAPWPPPPPDCWFPPRPPIVLPRPPIIVEPPRWDPPIFTLPVEPVPRPDPPLVTLPAEPFPTPAPPGFETGPAFVPGEIEAFDAVGS